MKGYKAISAQGKSPWGELRRKPGPSFQECSPSGGTENTLNSTLVKCCLPEKLIRDSMPRAFVEGWQHRYLLAHIKVSDFQKESSVQHKPYLYKAGTVHHPYQGMVGTLKSKFSCKGRASRINRPFYGSV